MALNPATLEAAETMRAHLAANPGGKNEKSLVEQVKTVAMREMPADSAFVGEALIQFGRLFYATIDRIRECDGMLDWESVATVATNVLTVAGFELYTEAAAAP